MSIPTDYTGNIRVSHRNVVCQNINCSNYKKIIARCWVSACPVCGKPGTYQGVLKNESNLDYVCNCELCYRNLRQKGLKSKIVAGKKKGSR